MLFRQLFDKESSTYTYLIADTELGAAILVDPVLEQVDRDLKLLTELNLILNYCLETHVHADHITGTERLRAATGCSGIVPAHAKVSCANHHIGDGEILTLGAVGIEAIATPGHTDSHMAYLVSNNHTDKTVRVLTGDALFVRGCGRTDFQSGDAGTLYDSVTQKLFTLPDETLVYPAHDYRGHTVSTIGEEKKWNPRFAEHDGAASPKENRDNYIEFMNNLDLPNPQKMMEAVPANEQCGRPVVAA